MGMEEKRQMKNLQDTLVPQVTAELEVIVGKLLSIELPSEGVADHLDAIRNLERSVRVLPAVFKEICKDEFGKEAVQDAISSIVFRNVTDTSSIGVVDGKADIAQRWKQLFWDENSLRKGIEKGL